MKSLLHIAKPVRKQGLFKHEDLAQALFFSKPALFTDKPFKAFKSSFPGDASVVFSLAPQNTANALEILSAVVVSFNNLPIKDKAILAKLPRWSLSLLLQSYNKGARLWYDYVQDEIEKFCETGYSRSQWEIAKLDLGVVFLERPPSFLHLLWVAVNSKMDKKYNIDVILEFQKSLRPWLNYNMWKETDKREKFLRTNVDFEEARLKMAEGSFGKETEEDLDIIK